MRSRLCCNLFLCVAIAGDRKGRPYDVFYVSRIITLIHRFCAFRRTHDLLIGSRPIQVRL